MMAGSEYPGFVSAEILPPIANHPDWALVQRFRKDEMAGWKDSEKRRSLFDKLHESLSPEALKPTDELRTDSDGLGSVATAIITEVIPGSEAAYRDWEVKIQSAQARSPGYCGAYVQPPTKGSTGRWTTLLRFDSPENLDKWFTSQERMSLVKESESFVKSTEFRHITNSFAGWFPVDSKGKSPPNWKTSLLVLMGLYPIVMCEIKFLNPLLHELNPALANFIGNTLSIAGTTWITIPAAIAAFSWWLFPDEQNTVQTNIKGLAAVAAIFAVEIALLWHLLL
jgi:antibiotic biosynthesis monooxygenase (ABM) superfamily enzyme